MKNFLGALVALLILAAPASAQWQTPDHSVPVGNGPGVTGFGSVGPCADGIAYWGSVSVDPSCMLFVQPSQFPINITSGHTICFADSDCQFGNAYSNYPLGVVSTYPTINGKAGSSIGSSTPGQTFTIRFASSGLAGSPIDITYTAIGGDTTASIAASLCTNVNANATIRNATTGQPIFCQSFAGSATFNLQYIDAFSATGATPLTTTSVGTGTVTLVAEVNVLDYVVMQLGRNVSTRGGQSGDSLYAFDFTGRSTAGFDTHYAQIGVSVVTPTSGSQAGQMLFSTAGGNGGNAMGRWLLRKGLVGYDNSQVLATGGDQGAGTINIPGNYMVNGTAIAHTATAPLVLTAGNLTITTTAPTVQVFTSGTDATYTRTSASVTRIEVEMVGGGGGGAGSGTGPGAATNGGNTCFKATGTACTTPLYQATGGTLGATTGAAAGGGGVAGSSTCNDNQTGGNGSGATGVTNQGGGHGGTTRYGAGGAGGTTQNGAQAVAAPNSGAGGGGAGNQVTANTGGGGGGGGWCMFIINSPASTYVYTIGAAGTAGTAGTGGFAGIAGAAGKIRVIEYYN